MTEGVGNDRVSLHLLRAPTINPVHLLIPFASTLSPDCRDALAGLVLPNLKRLLAQLAPESANSGDAGDAQSLSAPHERAIARDLGLPAQDGQIAFAAHCAADHSAVRKPDRAASAQATAPKVQTEAAWAFVTPCHWQMGQDHVRMLDPSGLQLPTEHAQLLRQAMQPYFAEDGIELQCLCMPGAMGQPAALSWLAQGELFRDMVSASLDRVSGRDLSDWMPQGPGAKVVRRLQSEMQMLLYTHPVNDERQQLGLLPVNSFWVSGCGALAEQALSVVTRDLALRRSLPVRAEVSKPRAPFDRPTGPTPSRGIEGSGRTDLTAPPPVTAGRTVQSDRDGGLTVEHSLRRAALADDAPAYVAAWQQIDAIPLQRMIESLRQGEDVRLSLCGERHVAHWSRPPAGLQAKAGQWLRGLRGPTVQQILESL